MPSPFPGMDPFLESPQFFADFHDSMIVYSKEVLHTLLPDHYFAKTRDRVWVEVSTRNIIPDVAVTTILKPRRREADQGNVAVMEPESDTAVVVEEETFLSDEREIFLEIFRLHGDDHQLVTSIEILSPANKSNAGRGLELYKQKQHEVLESPVHFIEIDLLRAGIHATSVRRHKVEEQVGPFDYHVCLHRFDQPKKFFVYPFHVTDKLPTIPVPLLPEDGSVSLDLQAVFTRCFEAGSYPREIRYDVNRLRPPLSDELAAWAKSRIEAGSAETSRSEPTTSLSSG